jgi:hypothetical protein
MDQINETTPTILKLGEQFYEHSLTIMTDKVDRNLLHYILPFLLELDDGSIFNPHIHDHAAISILLWFNIDFFVKRFSTRVF